MFLAVLLQKCETLQADLHGCQKELSKYEQDRQQKVAEIEQIHLRYEVQLAALKVSAVLNFWTLGVLHMQQQHCASTLAAADAAMP